MSMNSKTQLRLKIFGIANTGETLQFIIKLSYFPNEKKNIAIGRQSNCDILIQDKLLSKIHSFISFSENSGWMLMDGYDKTLSTNGTWYFSSKLGFISMKTLKSMIN